MSSEMLERITFSLLRLKRGGTVLSEQQVAAVLSILRGQDTVVCLPTGHGKSVIFEVVPLCHKMPDGLGEEGKKAVYFVVIVSLLLSLMTAAPDTISRSVRMVAVVSAPDQRS